MDCEVVVIGGSHHNTLGVVRSLGQKGIKPFVIIISKAKKSFVLQSKYAKGGLIIPSSEEIVLYVKKNLACGGKTIIISCADCVTCSFDQHYDELKERFIFFNGAEQGILSKLTNKYEMQHLAILCGLNVPRTDRVVYSVIPNSLIYPCVTKDVDNVTGSKHDMNVFQDRNQLTTFLQNRDSNYDILIQQFVEKDYEYQLIGCSLRKRNGEYDIIIPGHTKILRAQPVTNTGFLEYYTNDNFEFDRESCCKFIKACGYTGLFSMEFIRGKDGRDYFLEINFRNDGNAYVVTKAGVNLPYIYYLNAIGEDYSYEANHPIEVQVSMPVLKDFKTVLKGRVSFFQWVKDLRRTNCFFYRDKVDPKPMIAYLKELIISRI